VRGAIHEPGSREKSAPPEPPPRNRRTAVHYADDGLDHEELLAYSYAAGRLFF
jgi:hypothetical protein